MSKLSDAYDEYLKEKSKIDLELKVERAKRLTPAREKLAKVIWDFKGILPVEEIVKEFGMKNKNFVYDILNGTGYKPSIKAAPTIAANKKSYTIAKQDNHALVSMNGNSWTLNIDADGYVENIPDLWLESDDPVYREIIQEVQAK